MSAAGKILAPAHVSINYIHFYDAFSLMGLQHAHYDELAGQNYGGARVRRFHNSLHSLSLYGRVQRYVRVHQGFATV